jgi:hypothetical protein
MSGRMASLIWLIAWVFDTDDPRLAEATPTPMAV